MPPSVYGETSSTIVRTARISFQGQLRGIQKSLLRRRGPGPSSGSWNRSFPSMTLPALATKSDLRDLELKFESLRADLIGEIKGTIRWNFAFWIAQLAAIAGILKLLR